MTVDVAVIGAGPAGIAAAVCAAEAGQRVALLDEHPQVGGNIWRHRTRDTLPAVARHWTARLDRSGVEVMRGTTVAGVRDHGGAHTIVAERAGAAMAVDADCVVLATGARERFVPFPGWTLPGVIGIGGAQALLKAGASFAGKRVVIAGSGPLLLPVAAALADDGARLLLVAEQAPRAAVLGFALGLWRTPSLGVQGAAYRSRFARTPYRPGTWVTAARGEGVLREVDVTDGRSTRTIACDVLCAAHGLVPSTELARLLGCVIANGSVQVNDRQMTSRGMVYCAGEPTGIGGVELALVEGEIAGRSAAGAAIAGLPARRAHLRRAAERMDRAFTLRAELRGITTTGTIVCRCEDVRSGDILEGWTPRQAKLYTRAGMGACQGRVCGPALQFLHGWPDDSVRLPAGPVCLSTLVAGHDAPR